MTKVNEFYSFASVTATLFVIAAVLSGCATLRSGAHHDEQASFDDYQTFAWMEEKPLIRGEGEQLIISPLTEKKIVNAIEDELTRKGFTYSKNPDQADFIVAYTVGTREHIVAESYPVAYQGRWGWHLYGRYYYDTEVVHRSYSEGTLGIDIFDGTSKEPVWHGWASKTISGVDRSDPSPVIQKAVRTIINRFPPSS